MVWCLYTVNIIIQLLNVHMLIVHNTYIHTFPQHTLPPPHTHTYTHTHTHTYKTPTAERAAAAYRRMGLGGWAQGPSQGPRPGGAHGVRCVELDVRTLVVTLPWGAEVGRGIKYVENWIKAVKQVCWCLCWCWCWCWCGGGRRGSVWGVCISACMCISGRVHKATPYQRNTYSNTYCAGSHVCTHIHTYRQYVMRSMHALILPNYATVHLHPPHHLHPLHHPHLPLHLHPLQHPHHRHIGK